MNDLWQGIPVWGTPGTRPSTSGNIPHQAQACYYGDADPGRGDGLGRLNVVTSYGEEPPDELKAPTWHPIEKVVTGTTAQFTPNTNYANGKCTTAGVAGGVTKDPTGLYTYAVGDEYGAPSGGPANGGARNSDAAKLAHIAAILAT